LLPANDALSCKTALAGLDALRARGMTNEENKNAFSFGKSRQNPATSEIINPTTLPEFHKKKVRAFKGLFAVLHLRLFVSSV
jgi:hypothetical protein